jgi:hypothetical protein
MICHAAITLPLLLIFRRHYFAATPLLRYFRFSLIFAIITLPCHSILLMLTLFAIFAARDARDAAFAFVIIIVDITPLLLFRFDIAPFIDYAQIRQPPRHCRCARSAPPLLIIFAG